LIRLHISSRHNAWSFQSQTVIAPGTDTATSTQGVVEKKNDPPATLSVITDKDSYVVGDQVALSFYVDSPVSIDGADVVFSFDGTQLEIVEGLAKDDFAKEISQVAAVNQAQKQAGTASIQFAKSTKVGDKINYSFSALALPGEGVKGKAKLGTIYLRAKKAGDFPLAITFEKAGVSTDSNVAYQGRDILRTVEGTTVRVQSKN
jgi:hypothetical protein